MKGQDIVILLKLISLENERKILHEASTIADFQNGDPLSVRNLGTSLNIGKSEVSKSLIRSIGSGLLIKDRATKNPKPNRKNLFEFIVYGLRYVFPAKVGALSRGIPTTFSAPILTGEIFSAIEDNYVWPHADGQEHGQSLEPLYVPTLNTIEKDAELYACLALIDSIRIGRQREAATAKDLLQKKILARD